MKEEFLLGRRDMLIKSGKGLAALGLAAFIETNRPNLLTALARTPRFNSEFAGAHLIGFAPHLAREAEEELTYVPLASTCTLTCGLTLGPCYVASAALTRRDITDGQVGLPVRLGLRIIYADTCQPVTNATVDVWHTGASGLFG